MHPGAQLGEFVLFNDAGVLKVALIVKVWDATTVNLTVFEQHDYADTPMFTKYTSVVEGEDQANWKYKE